MLSCNKCGSANIETRYRGTPREEHHCRACYSTDVSDAPIERDEKTKDIFEPPQKP